MYVACITFLVGIGDLYSIYAYARVPENNIEGMVEKKYLNRY